MSREEFDRVPMSDDDEDEFNEDDWGDEEEAAAKTKDLFSEREFPGPMECLVAAHKEHGVDFKRIVAVNNLDCFGFFKLINYIRTHEVKPEKVEGLIKAKDWREEKYWKPALADDPILQLGMDIDDGCFMAAAGDEEMPALVANGDEHVKGENLEEMRKTVEKLRSERQGVVECKELDE